MPIGLNKSTPPKRLASTPYGPLSITFAILAACCRTLSFCSPRLHSEPMRLGAAVCLLPMRHPLQVAEDFAMLDLLSEGRLHFGAGRGMHPLEYATFNADWGTAQLRI